MKNQLAPSMLSADFGNLLSDIKKIETAGADMLHVDVMDGHFVPNISLGPVVLQGLAGKTSLPFDVHLMIENPDRYIQDFIFENTSIVSVHAEASVHLHRTIQFIKSFGVKAGVALNPATALENLDYILEEIDMVLLMTVNPGFGGQQFIESGLRKIEKLRNTIEARGLSVDIQIDGGVKLSNAQQILDAGANILVAGSAIFGSKDVTQETKKFLEILNKGDAK